MDGDGAAARAAPPAGLLLLELHAAAATASVRPAASAGATLTARPALREAWGGPAGRRLNRHRERFISLLVLGQGPPVTDGLRAGSSAWGQQQDVGLVTGGAVGAGGDLAVSWISFAYWIWYQTAPEITRTARARGRLAGYWLRYRASARSITPAAFCDVPTARIF